MRLAHLNTSPMQKCTLYTRNKWSITSFEPEVKTGVNENFKNNIANLQELFHPDCFSLSCQEKSTFKTIKTAKIVNAIDLN